MTVLWHFKMIFSKCPEWHLNFPRRSHILSALVVKAYWIFPTWRQLPEDLTTLFRIIGSYPILVHRTDVTWLKFAITCFLSLCKLKCRIYRHHCDGSSSYISSIIIIVVVKHRLTPLSIEELYTIIKHVFSTLDKTWWSFESGDIRIVTFCSNINTLQDCAS